MKHMESIMKVVLMAKNWFFALIAGFASFLIPLQPLVTVTFLTALLDWWVKLYCIYKSEGIESVKSNRMKDTFYKILLYFAFLFVVHTIDVLFIKPTLVGMIHYFDFQSLADFLTRFSATSIVTAMILLREGKSIDENWEQAFGISYIKIFTERFSWLFKSKSNDTNSSKNT